MSSGKEITYSFYFSLPLQESNYSCPHYEMVEKTKATKANVILTSKLGSINQ